MTLNQLESFVAVVKAGSYSLAAQKLFLSPQALIQKITRLEQELGFKLFVRVSKGIKLSSAGQEFYVTAEEMLAQYQQGLERARQKARQSAPLSVGIPEGINPAFLLNVCQTFIQRYPDIPLHYERLSLQDTVGALLMGKLDVGAQIGPGNASSGESETLHSVFLFPVSQYCLLPPGSPLARKKTISLRDLNNTTIGLWGPLQPYQALAQRIADQALNIQLRSVPENLSEALFFCMEGKPLITCMPIISHLKSTLTVLPIDFDVGLGYYLSYTQTGNENIERFIGVAKEIAVSETHPWKQTMHDHE